MKKINKKIWSITLVFTIMMSMVTIIGGASESEDGEKFFGTWTVIDPPGAEETVIYKFFSNGNFRWFDTENLDGYNIEGTWELAEDQLVLHWTYPTTKTETLDYSFSDSDQILVLTQNTTSVVLSKMQDEVDDTDKIIGTWSVEFPQAPPEWEGTVIFHFYSNGNFRWYDPEDLGGYNFEGTWDWVEGQIVLYQTYPEDTLYRDYFFMNNDQTLTLIIGTQGTFVLTKMQEEMPGWIYGTVMGTMENGEEGFLENAKVSVFSYDESWLVDSTYTDESGYYSISIEAGIYSMLAEKDGFTSSKVSPVMVVENEGNKQDFILEAEVENGWVYGKVLLRSNNVVYPANNISICLYPSNEDTSGKNYILQKGPCSFTNENGEFVIHSVDPGTYMIKAVKSKIYSAEQFIEIIGGQGTEVNFIINITETRLEIEKSIISGNVGGELHVSKENGAKYEYDIMIYDGVSIEVAYLSFGKMSLIISGDEYNSGRTISILTDLELFNTTSDFAVEYDGESIKMADNISDVLNPNDDGAHAEYLITIGTDGIEILISIPHFSEHEITISTLQPEGPIDEIVESVGGINAIMLYLSICIVVSVLFIGTIYMRRKL